MCVNTSFLSLFNSFRFSATQISSQGTLSPPCSKGERQCLSVDTLHLIVPPCLRKTSRLWRSQQEHALLSVYPYIWLLQSGLEEDDVDELGPFSDDEENNQVIFCTCTLSTSVIGPAVQIIGF